MYVCMYVCIYIYIYIYVCPQGPGLINRQAQKRGDGKRGRLISLI